MAGDKDMREISAQERTIMRIIWNARDRYLTAREIENAMLALDGKERNISSLMTVLAKLVDKGYLNPVKEFRKSTIFIPVIGETEYKVFVTDGFMRSVHNGEFSSFLSALVNSEKYSRNDISKISQLLGVLDEEGRGK